MAIFLVFDEQDLDFSHGDLMSEEFLYPKKPYCPEKKLIFAIIERAILDLKQPDHVARGQARTWILSSSTEEFSFLWGMDMLGLIHCVPVCRRKADSVFRQATAYYNSEGWVSGRRNPKDGLFELHYGAN